MDKRVGAEPVWGGGRLWELPLRKELVLFTRISGFYLTYFNRFSAVVRNHSGPLCPYQFPQR